MNNKKILYISSIYLFLLGVSFLPKTWIFFGNTEIFQSLLFIFLLLHIFYFYKLPSFQIELEKALQNKNLQILFIVLAMLFFLSFPIRSLEMGDGILLIENLILETKAFGYTVVPDELLEGFTHSLLYKSLLPYTENPMISYRIISTICGGFFLILLTFQFWKQKSLSMVVLLLLSNGGSLLFYGYMENYVLTTLLISTTILYGFNTIQIDNYNTSHILIMAFLAALCAITHLISGFMIFGLIYYCVVKSNMIRITSEKYTFASFFHGELLKNSLLAGTAAMSILLPLYLYFIYFSDLRIDFSLAHASHPPFLSLKKIFSLNHLYDLVLEAVFIAYASIVSIKFGFFFEKKAFLELLTRKEFKFILLIFMGFFLHYFTYNPLLGYPADWDLMGFIWIPLFLGTLLFLNRQRQIYLELLPLFFFLGIFMILTAQNLSQKKNEEDKIHFLAESIENYLPKFKNIEYQIPNHQKKTYLHTDYFLFRTHKILSLSKEPQLLTENEALQREFNDLTLMDDKKRWKDFLQRATEFHIKYLEIKKE
jgi:hypothetical protein